MVRVSHFWSLIPKAQASGTNTISHLQLTPPTSSSGTASHKTEPHRYATTTIPQNLTLENGGWNTENKGTLKISRTQCYALTTYIHARVLTWKQWHSTTQDPALWHSLSLSTYLSPPLYFCVCFCRDEFWPICCSTHLVFAIIKWPTGSSREI